MADQDRVYGSDSNQRKPFQIIMNEELHKTTSGGTTTERAKESMRETGESVREIGKDTVQQLKETARETADSWKGEAESTASEQKNRVAGKVTDYSAAVRRASEKLKEDHEDNIARYTEAVADKLDEVSGYIRDRNFDDMWEDAEDLARKRPEIFLGGMFLAGLALARFMKAKPRRRYRERNYAGRSSTSVTERDYSTRGEENASGPSYSPVHTPGTESVHPSGTPKVNPSPLTGSPSGESMESALKERERTKYPAAQSPGSSI
jgi:gas vesicle protein